MIYKIYIKCCFFVAILLSGLPVRAETMVMLPGFLSQGMDWRFNQVTPALQSLGWTDGGNFYFQAGSIRNAVQLARRPRDVFYTVNLPTKAPVPYQAQILEQYLQAIHRIRQEPMVLVGHSAGGVVARYWLVASNSLPVHTLITIASPHLGTPMAELTEVLAETPLLSMMENIGITDFSNARGLYANLREERPDTFLYWLNHQPHPALRYVSVVRSSQNPEAFDFVVPESSQDMNHVYSLQGRTERLNSGDSHFLSMNDGYLIGHILATAPANRR
ncbi:MAG: alpha/beta fold hydrolase [Thiothrix sp.]|nr:alpha/beta fold hydrolase [Thiothrix sp.]HPQ95709.1 thioesterase domain-containing protein [Thiolinea sp.]